MMYRINLLQWLDKPASVSHEVQELWYFLKTSSSHCTLYARGFFLEKIRGLYYERRGRGEELTVESGGYLMGVQSFSRGVNNLSPCLLPQKKTSMYY